MNYTDLLAHRDYYTNSSDEFALKYSKLAGNITEPEHVAFYYAVMEGTDPGLEGLPEEDRKDIRFGAFYVLCVYYRRQKEFATLLKFVNAHNGDFSGEELYAFQKAVALKSGFPSIGKLESAINLFRDIMNARQEADNMPFFIQAYTDTVARYYDELNKETLDPEDQKTLNEAIKLLRQAIAIRPEYAKYYYTLSKLYRVVGQFDLAKENIRKAIELEDSNEGDYALRINEFEILNSRIDLERAISTEVKNLKEMQEDFSNMKNDLEKSKIDILAFLGFFTGIISFILGSFQLGEGLEFNQRIQMMSVLLGCLIIAFSVFRLFIGQFKLKDLLLCLFAVLVALGLIFACSLMY